MIKELKGPFSKNGHLTSFLKLKDEDGDLSDSAATVRHQPSFRILDRSEPVSEPGPVPRPQVQPRGPQTIGRESQVKAGFVQGPQKEGAFLGALNNEGRFLTSLQKDKIKK